MRTNNSRTRLRAIRTDIFALASLLVVLLYGSGAKAATSGFGSPPSGNVPILYNDRTVYAKPDLVKQGRVLAALVKAGHMFVPLRRMLEQIGAAVFISADGTTVTALKNENSVSITLGKGAAIINGETRPFGVPPLLYKGVVLVPVRVLAEALGAYVQWVPDRRIVVVRSNPPPPPPTPPTPPTFNEFSNGRWCRGWLC